MGTVRPVYKDGQGRIQRTVTTDQCGKTTWRDSTGRIQGTSTTDRYGKTTYRDASGRIQGTETTDRYGKTTYRDAQGRIQATKKGSSCMTVGGFPLHKFAWPLFYGLLSRSSWLRNFD